jgi:uncharacterized protein
MTAKIFQPSRPVFLTANWRWLVMLNYRVPEALLTPYLPRGTELDLWNGSPYLSVVGFMFENLRVLGTPVPFHQSFAEVNLRFYVQRVVNGNAQHAVTFIREFVSRSAVSLGAVLAYNEPYRTVSMRHDVAFSADGSPASAVYRWRAGNQWSELRAATARPGTQPAPNSECEFMTVRHWGYTRQRDGSTVEYEVRHPRWTVWRLESFSLTTPRDVFGSPFAEVLAGGPDSSLLADGSPVSLHAPLRLR